MQHVRVTVAAGDGAVARRDDVAVVVPAIAGADDDSIGGLLAGVLECADAADPVAAVASVLEQAGAGAPAVGVVVMGDDPHAVLHGEVDVHVTAPGAAMQLRGTEGGGVLVSRLPDGVDSIVLGAGRPGAPAYLDLVDGVVPGGGVVVRVVRSAPGSVAAPPVATADDPAAPPPPPEGAAPAFESVSLLDPPAAAPEVAPLPVESADDEQSTDGDVPVEDDAVRVEGLRCRRGHFNHPDAANCAWCGLAMVQDSYVLVQGPRPPLGVLVVNGQATFTLDSGYVLGRAPDRAPDVADGSHRALPLEDPDRSVSRVHAAVELQGWDVVAVDRESANGTWVLEPGGQNWERLVPGSPRMLRPGGQVQVGPHRITYHSHHVR